MSGTARFQQHRDADCHQAFFFFLQGMASKEIHAILTETLACFLPVRDEALSAPLYVGDVRSERKLRRAATLLTKKTLSETR